VRLFLDIAIAPFRNPKIQRHECSVLREASTRGQTHGYPSAKRVGIVLSPAGKTQ